LESSRNKLQEYVMKKEGGLLKKIHVDSDLDNAILGQIITIVECVFLNLTTFVRNIFFLMHRL